MYILSDAYKSFQVGLSCIGLGSAGVVTAYGIISSIPIFVAGGIVCCIPPSFLLISSMITTKEILQYKKICDSKMEMYDTDIRKFNAEIVILQTRLEATKESRSKIVSENINFQKKLELANLEIMELQKLKDLTKSQIEELKTTNKMFLIENKELRESIDSLNNLR